MKSRTQSEHERINRREYPGTRQMCVACDEPTGRCESDGIWSDALEGWVCPECSHLMASAWDMHTELVKLQNFMQELYNRSLGTEVSRDLIYHMERNAKVLQKAEES